LEIDGAHGPAAEPARVPGADVFPARVRYERIAEQALRAQAGANFRIRPGLSGPGLLRRPDRPRQQPAWSRRRRAANRQHAARARTADRSQTRAALSQPRRRSRAGLLSPRAGTILGIYP